MIIQEQGYKTLINKIEVELHVLKQRKKIYQDRISLIEKYKTGEWANLEDYSRIIKACEKLINWNSEILRDIQNLSPEINLCPGEFIQECPIIVGDKDETSN